jgi:queuine tRNA-ribosyltransferase subunit QTRTD1
MSFVLRSTHSQSFRTGLLQSNGTAGSNSNVCSLQTPLALVACQRAFVPFVTADVQQSLPASAVLAVPYAEASFLRNAGRSWEELSRYQRPVLLTHRLFDASEDIPFSNKGVTFQLGCGRVTIESQQFQSDVTQFRPTFFEALYPFTGATKGRSRQSRAMKQTLAMLQENTAALGSERLFAVLQGGVDVNLREIAARDLLKQPCLGYSLAGFGSGETLDERKRVLDAVLPMLPHDKPRMISGIDSFEQMLACVALGVDLFVTRAAQLATEAGVALSVVLSGPDVGRDCSLDLKDAKYRTDHTPLDSASNCPTSRKFTRAYLNHLINTHELLANTLLMSHNVYAIDAFFAAVRTEIDAGTFVDWHARFVSNCKRSD